MHDPYMDREGGYIRTYAHVHIWWSYTRGPRGCVKTPMGSPLRFMLFCRGDMFHAGAGYLTVNRRLFLSVSCDEIPVTDDVSLFIFKNNYVI